MQTSNQRLTARLWRGIVALGLLSCSPQPARHTGVRNAEQPQLKPTAPPADNGLAPQDDRCAEVSLTHLGHVDCGTVARWNRETINVVTERSCPIVVDRWERLNRMASICVSVSDGQVAPVVFGVEVRRPSFIDAIDPSEGEEMYCVSILIRVGLVMMSHGEVTSCVRPENLNLPYAMSLAGGLNSATPYNAIVEMGANQPFRLLQGLELWENGDRGLVLTPVVVKVTDDERLVVSRPASFAIEDGTLEAIVGQGVDPPLLH